MSSGPRSGRHRCRRPTHPRRYGLSWQVGPAGLDELIGDRDPERAARATRAMYGMRKIDIAAVRAAADGD